MTATPQHLGAGLARGLDGGDRRAARGRRVLQDHDLAARDVRSLDAALHPVRLGLLAHDERVEVLPARRGGVQQGGRDGVGAERQPADGVDLRGAQPDLLEQVEHQVPDQRGGAVVQRDAAQVDVVVGLAARRERDLPVHDGEVLDELEQLLAGRRGESWVTAVRLPGGRGRAGCRRTSGARSGRR